MELEERAEEILEALWVGTQEEKRDFLPLSELGVEVGQAPLNQLLEAGYVTLSDGQVRLTEAGRPEARQAIRRTRLAERLLADVLDSTGGRLDERACKFEHLLVDRGLEESICTLLGHPRFCPHNKPIPPGRCCSGQSRPLQRLVSPLSELAPGQGGTIAYVLSAQSDKLQKLIAMGLLPGAPIQLLQSFPSFLFQVRQTQFAVDKEIADAIYVRLEDKAVPPGRQGKERAVFTWERGRFTWGRRWLRKASRPSVSSNK